MADATPPAPTPYDTVKKYQHSSPLTQISQETQEGPSKSELKKRAKQAEKDKKAAEKAAKQAELAQQQAATEGVCPFLLIHSTDAHNGKPRRTLLPISTASYPCTNLNLGLARRELRSHPSVPLATGRPCCSELECTPPELRETRWSS